MAIIKTEKQLRDRPKHDVYLTPVEVVQAAIPYVFNHRLSKGIPTGFLRVLDAGCGEGVWGHYFKEYYPRCSITGVDIRDNTLCSDYADSYDSFISGDYREIEFDESFDLVLGNPPFGARLPTAIVKKSQSILKEGGVLLLLLNTNYRHSSERAKLFNQWRPEAIFDAIERVSWFETEGSKTGDWNIAFYRWVKGFNPDYYIGKNISIRGNKK